MNSATIHALRSTGPRIALAASLAGCCIAAVAQERAPLGPSLSYPYANALLTTQKSVSADANRTLSAPVMNPIAPDARASSLVLPERRSAIDQMLESHEFTFGTKSKPTGLSAKQPAVGTNIEMDAVKLRVSRDKVLIKAQWSFN